MNDLKAIYRGIEVMQGVRPMPRAPYVYAELQGQDQMPPAYAEWPGLNAAEGFGQCCGYVVEGLPLGGQFAIPIAPSGYGFRRSSLMFDDPFVPFPHQLIGT